MEILEQLENLKESYKEAKKGNKKEEFTRQLKDLDWYINNASLTETVEDGNAQDMGLYLEILKNAGYRYIIKFEDNFLSGWGYAENKKSLQIIACQNWEQVQEIREDGAKDRTLSRFNVWNIADTQKIKSACRGKCCTIRNDWTRAFSEVQKEDYKKNYSKAYALACLYLGGVADSFGYREKAIAENLERIETNPQENGYFTINFYAKDGEFFQAELLSGRITG